MIKTDVIDAAQWQRAEALYAQAEADRKQWMDIALRAEARVAALEVVIAARPLYLEK